LHCTTPERDVRLLVADALLRPRVAVLSAAALQTPARDDEAGV
jgi:hypothetical protein